MSPAITSRVVSRLSLSSRLNSNFSISSSVDHSQRPTLLLSTPLNRIIRDPVSTKTSAFSAGIRSAGTMASASSKKEYFVVVPDKPGVLQKRIEVRDTHLNNLGPVLESGFLKVGGATFEEHPKEGETPKMNGSMLIVMAESEQEIRDTLSKDVYATSGVWDVENMKITPFRSAIRLAL